MKKTIAIVCSDIIRLGGIERTVCRLSESLIEFGEYEVIIISLNTSEGAPRYKTSPKVRLIHLSIKNSTSLSRRTFSYPEAIGRISEICRKHDIDIVMGTETRLNILLRFVKGKNLIKIACEHGNYNNAPFHTSLVRRFSYTKMDAVVLLTQRDAACYGFCKNTKVIPNAAPFIAKHLSDLNHNVAMSAGRFEKIKRFDVLIEAVSLIKDQCPGWKFKIFGEGSEQKPLTDLIAGKRLEGIVELVPTVSDIEKEYCNSSIYAMSSKTEAFPMVLLEAKSCGLPVVSFDCPNGPLEIIRNGIDGLLVENGNVEALAQGMLKLIKDPLLRHKYGREAAKDAIERFSPKHIFEMWEKLFDELKK